MDLRYLDARQFDAFTLLYNYLNEFFFQNVFIIGTVGTYMYNAV